MLTFFLKLLCVSQFFVIKQLTQLSLQKCVSPAARNVGLLSAEPPHLLQKCCCATPQLVYIRTTVTLPDDAIGRRRGT